MTVQRPKGPRGVNDESYETLSSHHLGPAQCLRLGGRGRGPGQGAQGTKGGQAQPSQWAAAAWATRSRQTDTTRETVKELMAAAVAEEKGFRPGLVSVVQTFGDRANFHAHVHALVSRGGWTASGEWILVPYVDEAAAQELFRHKVPALLRRRGLLSQERIELLLSWRRSGFSVHNRVYVPAGDSQGLEALVRYMMRSPVSLSRLRLTPGSHEVLYARKRRHDQLEPTESERIDAMEFVARVLVQIPDPRRHLVRYYGAYSNVARGKRRKAEAPPQPSVSSEASMAEPTPEGADRAALRRRWADLIRRVYDVDPRVSTLRRRNESRRLHHPTRCHQAHPQSSPQAREALSRGSTREPLAPNPKKQVPIPEPPWKTRARGRR